MRLIDRLRASEERVMTNPWGEWPGDMVSQSWTGTRINTTSALQLLTIYGCNRFICEGISTLPIDTFRDVGGESVPLMNPPWLEQPTADLDRVSWLTQILSSLLLSGNAYLLKGYQNGVLDTLTPLDPVKVIVKRERGVKVFMIAGERFENQAILHIPGAMQPGSDVGLSPVEAARQTIGLGLATLEHGARFFGQGANQSGVIETPGELTPGKAKEMAKDWARSHSGLRKAHLPGVLEGGATWKPTSISNEQAQFLATREYTAAEIASQMFLIDPTEFGLNPSGNGRGSITYANLEQRNARKVQVTFMPWFVRLERAFSSLLAMPRYVKFNIDALMRGDTKTQAETFQIATGNKAWMLPSEVRSLLDLSTLAGIDEQPAAGQQTNSRMIERDEHGRLLRVVG